MVTYNISLNDDLADVVDKAVKAGKFANRSEFFRYVIRTHFIFKDGSPEIRLLKKDDPDYKLIEKLSSGAEFVNSSDVLDEV